MDGVNGIDRTAGAVQMALLRKALELAGSGVLRLLESTPAAREAANPPHLGQRVDASA